MQQQIEAQLSILYKLGITTREQVLAEMLRVKLLQRHLRQASVEPCAAELFRQMQNTTEPEIGPFPGDQAVFSQVYSALGSLDLVHAALAIYDNDRSGVAITPRHLSDYVVDRLAEQQPASVLIAEAERHLAGIQRLVLSCPSATFTLTTQLHLMRLLLELVFADHDRVRVVFTSVYSPFLIGEHFDCIYAMPASGAKAEAASDQFLTRETEGVALENLLTHLSDSGSLLIALPAKITFAGMGYERLRQKVAANYGLKSILQLPDGIFRPATAVRHYLFDINRQPSAEIRIGELVLHEGGGMQPLIGRMLATRELAAQADWRLELLLSDDNQVIRRFRESPQPKARLGDVADIFRGKSILKKDTTPGEIAVLNISNIDCGQIDYSSLDTIDEARDKVERYMLQAGDVVLACRGTAIKSAVFQTQPRAVIASANLIVVRPRPAALPTFVHLFLESPLGQALIQSFQRGTVVINLNHADIAELQIPLPPVCTQKEMVDRYLQEQTICRQTVQAAEKRWAEVRRELHNRLLKED